MMREDDRSPRNQAVRVRVIAAVACASLVACGGQQSDAPAAAEATRTARVFNAPIAGIEPRLVMGLLAAGDTSRLGPVGHGAFTPDGGFVVTDTAANLVRGYSGLGQAVFTVGGPGVGPGTFGRIASLAVTADSVFVFDDRLWRITAFDRDGVVLSTRRVEPRPSVVPTATTLRGEDGQWLHVAEQVGTTANADASEATVVRATATLARWSAAASAWTTVALFPGTEVYLAGDSADSPVFRTAPFARAPLWTSDGQGGYWYADSDVYTLVRIGAAGDTVTRVTYGATGARLTETERRDWVVDGGRLDASSAEARTRATLPVPDRRPVLTALLASPAGEPWVALDRGVPDSLEWHALDQFGGPHRRVPLPRRLRILAVRGDTMLVAGTDANGVWFAGRFVLGAAISDADVRAGARVATVAVRHSRVAPQADPVQPSARPAPDVATTAGRAGGEQDRRKNGGS
jgi:hypothetical protein